MTGRFIAATLMAGLAAGAPVAPALAQQMAPPAGLQRGETPSRPDAAADPIKAEGARIGITRQQAPAWAAYMHAVMDAEPAGHQRQRQPAPPSDGGPGRAPDRHGGQPPAPGQAGRMPAGGGPAGGRAHEARRAEAGAGERRVPHPALLGERLAEHATGDEARALRRSAAELRAVLTPRQMAALIAAENAGTPAPHQAHQARPKTH